MWIVVLTFMLTTRKKEVLQRLNQLRLPASNQQAFPKVAFRCAWCCDL